MNSDNLLTPGVIMIPASQSAKKELTTTAPLGSRDDCAPVPSVYNSPSAIAIKDMPELQKKYPNAFIVSFSPQIACNDAGVAYTGDNKAVATVYTNNTGQTGNAQFLADELITIHEAGGHLYNLGHAGSIDFSTDNLFPGLANARSEVIKLSESKYGEYQELGNPMGAVDTGEKVKITDNPPYFDQLDDDVLRTPEAILRGHDAYDARFIDEKWTILSNKDINNGIYAMVPLDNPITLQGVNGVTTFDNFAITLTYSPSRKWGMDPYASQAGYGMEYLLYSSNNHNTAWPGSQLGFPATNGYTIRIDNQVIQLRGGKNGLSIRTFLPEPKVTKPTILYK
jgi:hypothetical protein